MADKFYYDNPIPANNRGTVYGVTGIPMAVLDGGILEEGLGYPLTYDFSTRYPSVEDIKLRSLTEPDFKLTVDIEYNDTELKISTDIEALKDMGHRELTLYAIVLENRIMDPEYVGTNGTTRFYQVARRLLPDAAGHPFSKSWLTGEIESIVLTWDLPSFPMNEEDASIVVFLQDENTREILQAATKPEYSSVSTFDRLESPSHVLLYPNPAREMVTVYFEDVPTEAVRFTLYDLSGKKVLTDVIEPWQQRYTRSLGDIEQGLYIVEIRTKDYKRVIHRSKLFHY